MSNLNNLKKDFPIFKRKIRGYDLVYLDNAATTQKPASVIKAIKNYYEMCNANIHRGIHTLAEEATEKYEKARNTIAKFINSQPQEIVFVRNSTEALNLIAYSYGKTFLKKGDEVIISESEHHSNIIPWQLISSDTGIKIKFIPITKDGYLDIKALKKLINNKTKIISVVHVSNVLGTINPVEEIGKIAKKKGIIFIVDASQSAGKLPLDVKRINCDFMAVTGHKLMGPTGIGFLYGKEELLEKMPPFLGGGDMISEVYKTHAVWNKLPYKFEAGTPDIAGVIGLGAAVDYINSIGIDNIFKHSKEITKYAYEKLSKIKKLTIYGPNKWQDRLGVIAFNIEGIHPHDVAQLLDEEGIAIRSGFHCAMPLHIKMNLTSSCRASFYIYNTKKDIDKLAAVLNKTIAVFAK